VIAGTAYPRRLGDWQAVLRAAGYPDRLLVWDFETYFDDHYTLRKMSTVEYIMDARFEVLALGVTDSETQARVVYRGEEMVSTYLGCVQRKYGADLPSWTVAAQNAKFDMGILAFRYNLWPKFLTDLLGLARHWNARIQNHLSDLGERYELSTKKGDTLQFKHWTNRVRFETPKGRKKNHTPFPFPLPVMRDAQWKVMEQYTLNDVSMELQLLLTMLPRLSAPGVELPLLQHTLELYTRPTIRVDSDRACALKAEMEAKIDRVCEDVGHIRKSISGNNSFETLLTAAIVSAGDDPMLYTKSMKSGTRLAIAKADPQREVLLAHPDSHVRSLMNARIAVKSWPLHISRISNICSQANAQGGVLPVPLNYHGAHTGRWSGGEKINLQNLGSRGDPLAAAIRELLVAEPGMVFVIADASQIEARVLAWIAGQWDVCGKFAAGVEIYAEFASKVLGWPVRKPRKDDPAPVFGRYTWARNSVGKVGILGCGYGMGPNKVVSYSNDTVDFETAKGIVSTYRRENAKIVDFWRDIERAFLYTAEYGEPCALPRGLYFHHEDDCDVVITLPNGRELKYHNVLVERDSRGGKQIEVHNGMEHTWVRTWGGSLTENVVQAMSRDILAEALLRTERMGYRVVHHVHDELIVRVPEAQGGDVLPQVLNQLSVPPVWAPDCPLAAEGLVTNRYGGH